MKRAKNVDDLAASLSAAATVPLVQSEAPAITTRKPAAVDTVQVTLRPPRSLHAFYIGLAADRSKLEGRTISAQEIMLEVLTGRAQQ